MITILNISDTKFSYNGIAYFKNFTPFVTGNKVSIVNTYDACISLTNFPTIYSDISVDGVTYGSVSALQNALLPVLFNRTFSQSGSLTAGYIPKATGSNILGNSLIYDNGVNAIGIGTINPVNGGSSAKWITLEGSAAYSGGIIGSINGVQKMSLYYQSGYAILQGNTGEGIKLMPNLNNGLTISSAGNVGIGIVVANAKFQVDGQDIYLTGGTDNRIRFSNYNFTGNNMGAAIGYTYITANTQEKGELVFYTNPNFNSTGSLAERMRINSAGQIEIKGTSTSTNAQALLTNSDTDFNIYASNSSGVTKNINFFYNGGSGQAMRITSSGYVGINGNPAQKFDVFGISRISDTNPALQLYNTSNGDNWVTLQGEADSGTGGKLVIYTKRNGNSENAKMAIRENGYIAMGSTTADTGLLTILKNSTYNSHSGAGLSIQSNINNAYTELQLGADDTLNIGYIQSKAKNTSFSTKALCLNPNGGNVGVGTPDPRQNFVVSTSGGYGGFEVFIDSTSVGIQAYNRSVNAYRQLNIDSSALRINYLGTGLVYSNGGILTNTNPSDRRLKDEITDLEYGLNEISQLRPVTYLWKNDKINQGKQFGFIAQEVQKIMPDLVKEFETKDGDEDVIRLGLDKEAIFVAMVNAIKELQLEIQILKN